MTYARCKLAVKSELHGAAFPAYAGCRIFLPMAETRHYLRAWREFRHLTQQQVVDRLDGLDDERIPRTAATLSRIENGKNPYTERLLLALAEIYAAEPWELIGRDPSKSGEIVDLLARLTPEGQANARAMIEGLTLAEQRAAFTPAPPSEDRLAPRKAG